MFRIYHLLTHNSYFHYHVHDQTARLPILQIIAWIKCDISLKPCENSVKKVHSMGEIDRKPKIALIPQWCTPTMWSWSISLRPVSTACALQQQTYPGRDPSLDPKCWVPTALAKAWKWKVGLINQPMFCLNVTNYGKPEMYAISSPLILHGLCIGLGSTGSCWVLARTSVTTSLSYQILCIR